MTTHTTATIRYLGSVTTDGAYHQGWQDRRPSIPVAPTVVPLPTAMPVAVHVGWGDRERDAALPVYTDPDEHGISMSFSRTGGDPDRVHVWIHTPGGRYEHHTLPEWSPAFLAAVTVIREAAQVAEDTRPEVATVCAAYRAILAGIDAQLERHERQWDTWRREIARRLRRKSIQVGEQTVRGLCIVRSSRGTPLAYAEVWDGRWTGRLRRYGS